MCILLAILLLAALLLGASQPPAALPAAQMRAWWGLLCPWLFGAPAQGESDSVTFAWPLIDRLLRLWPINA